MFSFPVCSSNARFSPGIASFSWSIYAIISVLLLPRASPLSARAYTLSAMTCRDSLSVTALFFVSSKASRLSSLAFFRSLYSCVSCFTFPACSSLSVLISSDVAHNATSAAAATPASDAKSTIGFAFITAFNAVFATVCIFVATVIPSREVIYAVAESIAERNASFCSTFHTPIAVPSPTIPLSIGTRFSETIFSPLFAYGSRFLI